MMSDGNDDGLQNQDSARLEVLLQEFLNEITYNFEKYKVPVEKLDNYEKRVKRADSLLHILEVIHGMFKDLMKKIDDSLNLAVKEDIEQGNTDLDESQVRSEIGEENYQNLEKVLQKYEAEIRNHIRIEQQLKIYTESLQEKFDDKEKIFKSNLESKSSKLKEVEKRLSKLMKKLDSSKKENEKLKETVSFLKSKKMRKSENLTGHKYSSSIDNFKNQKKNKKGYKDDKLRSVSRNRSRDISPLDKKKNKNIIDRRLAETYLSRKGMRSHLLMDFQKLYKEARKGKKADYNIKRYANLMRLKGSNPIGNEKGAKKPTGGKLGNKSLVSRSHRGKEAPSSKKIRGHLHSRKTSDLMSGKRHY